MMRGGPFVTSGAGSAAGAAAALAPRGASEALGAAPGSSDGAPRSSNFCPPPGGTSEKCTTPAASTHLYTAWASAAGPYRSAASKKLAPTTVATLTVRRMSRERSDRCDIGPHFTNRRAASQREIFPDPGSAQQVPERGSAIGNWV